MHLQQFHLFAFLLQAVLCTALANLNHAPVHRLERRILGGQPVQPGQFNYTALIEIQVSARKRDICGGTLISPNVIVTAAHCLQTFFGDMHSADQLHVAVGKQYVPRLVIDEKSGYKVKRTVAHKGYSADTVVNDIGIVVLDKDVSKDVATPAKIVNARRDIFDNSERETVALGYGATSNEVVRGTMKMSDQLMWVGLGLGTEDHCEDLYSYWKYDGMLCSDGIPNKDTCLGDSGGPLLWPIDGDDDNSDEYALLGITSFSGRTSTNNTNSTSADDGSRSCGTDGGAGYYTFVPAYLDWIAKNAELDLDDITISVDESDVKSESESNSSSDDSLVSSGESDLGSSDDSVLSLDGRNDGSDESDGTVNGAAWSISRSQSFTTQVCVLLAVFCVTLRIF